MAWGCQGSLQSKKSKTRTVWWLVANYEVNAQSRNGMPRPHKLIVGPEKIARVSIAPSDA